MLSDWVEGNKELSDLVECYNVLSDQVDYNNELSVIHCYLTGVCKNVI